MKKVINEKGELVLHRTENMQYIMNNTYALVPIIAVMHGTINGAWESAISDYLKRMYQHAKHSNFIKSLLLETGIDGITQHAFDKAAILILNSSPNGSNNPAAKSVND